MHWDNLFKHPSSLTGSTLCQEELLLARTLTVRVLDFCPVFGGLRRQDWGQLVQWLGLADSIEVGYDEQPEDILRKIKLLWRRRYQARSGVVRTLLVDTCTAFAERLSLTAVERDLLVLAWMKLRHESLRDLYDSLPFGDLPQQVALLSRLTGHPDAEVALALQPGSRMVSYGLLEIPQRLFQNSEPLTAGAMLSQLAPALLETVEGASSDALLAKALVQVCPRQPQARWRLSDFPQVPQRQLLLNYLRRARTESRRGANVLIHGVPGVGKTELARTLAAALSQPLYGVPAQDVHEMPLPPADRLKGYHVAQKLIAGQPDGLVLFDEVEDVLAGGGLLPKAWTNQLLEQNPVPALWLSNAIDWLDPAFLRRFDLIVEVVGQSDTTHRQQLAEQLEPLPVTEGVRHHLVQQPWMTPALACQLRDMAPLLPVRKPLRSEAQVRRLLQDRLSALRLPPEGLDEVFSGSSSTEAAPLAMPPYRLAWLNTDPDLKQLLAGLKRRGRARLCLHGPPGAGKTALAEHLAQTLRRPLLLASASSLLNRYVGGTEERIASLFAKAREQKAVLLVDEIDSLLMDRAGASHSWEISHTNELLVQLERFDGIVFATTNRIDSLDRAVMRRFDLKVGFDYLRPAQLRDLIQQVLPTGEHGKVDDLATSELSQRRLTPGNVRTALDQIDLRGLPLRLDTLLAALELEEREQHRGSLSRPIGFTAELAHPT